MAKSRIKLEQLKAAPVPCAGCTLCCQNDALRLLPEDDPSQYQTEPHPRIRGALVLAHQPNGDCIYLDRAKGCTIYARRPAQCRTMDCRLFPLVFPTKSKFRKATGSTGNPAVWQRGRELLAQFPRQQP